LLLIAFVRAVSLGLLTLATLCISTGAGAQTDKAAAEALFREGMRLAKAGNYSEACPKLEESQRVEPSLGVQYYLADCFERIGRSASAWANFVEVANKAHVAGEAAKEQTAREHADALEPKLARLRVELENGELPGLSVQRGQVLIGPGQWGVALPVDPGSYELRATAPGYAEWKKTVAVAAGASVNEKIPALQALPAASPSTNPVAAAPVPLAVTPPAREPSSWGTQRTVAVVVAGVGIATLATSGVLALLANSANKSSKDPGKCAADDTCTDAGLDARDKALKLADAATVVSIAGAALAVGGAVIWLTAPPSHRDAPTGASARLGFGPSRLVLQGQF
jgi:serine/threonine-protein kinase